jgi:cytochrome P450
MPDKYVDKMNPQLHILLVLQRVSLSESFLLASLMTNLTQDLKSKIANIANDKDKSAEHRTIFHEMLESDLPPEEKGLQRLGHEAQTVIGAGLTTTAWAFSHATFYILNQPETLRKLQDELRTAIPDPAAPLDWLQLEELPYLGGCIKEAIRLSYGLSGRHPRISPDRPMKYKTWNIPAGTPVSMTIVDVHHDEAIYPQSHSFIPERWLNTPKTENGSSLDRYLVSFGKGPRSCLGIKYVLNHMLTRLEL